MIETSGVIEKEQGNGFYLVTLEQPAGHQCLCRAAGKLTKFRIKLLAGDKVLVEISPYDLTRGRRASKASVQGCGARSPAQKISACSGCLAVRQRTSQGDSAKFNALNNSPRSLRALGVLNLLKPQRSEILQKILLMRRCAKSHTKLALQQSVWSQSGSQSWTQHLNAESVLPPAGQQPESKPWTALSAMKTATH